MGTKHMGALSAIFIIAAALMGCSQEGNLVIQNDASTEFQGYVEDQFVMISPGDDYSTTIYIGKTLAFVGPKDLTVTLAGSAWTKKAFNEEILVTSDEEATYRVIDDIGALNFKNNYIFAVNQVAVKMCDSTTFGPDLISGGRKLSPGDETLVQLDPGCYDILVNYGREERLDTVTAVNLTVGQVIELMWAPEPGAELARNGK